MDTELIIRHADTEDINSIGFLAHQIWPITYGEIIEKKQLDYMLQLMYSPDSLKKQMQQENIFLIAELDEEPVGFAAYSATKEPGTFKLHKLYVRTDIQGKGLGKALINAVTEEIREKNGHCLRLNVNRYNKAKQFYERFGFSVVKEEDVDIGNGYFMNDYVMEKPV